MSLNNITIPTERQTSLHQNFNKIFKDENTDFTERLTNLWSAQMETVSQYGRDGLMLVLDYEINRYTDKKNLKNLQIMHYTEAPNDCPWHHLHLLPLSEAIRKAWEASPMEFSKALEEECEDLFAVHASGKWFLIYAFKTANYQGAEYYEFFSGREPHPDAQLPKELIAAGWKMPEDLKAFYAVHGNFGDVLGSLDDTSVGCISSVYKLEASLTFLEEYVEEWEADYSFFDLLPFCEDGAGNSQNFYKAKPENSSYLTVDWDHETKEISQGENFADYINEHFGYKLQGY